MKITRTSQFTGKTSSMELDVTPEQIALYEQGRDLLQNVFPQLNAGEREFIKTGVTPEDWDKMFS